ncbi:hypothetical protein O4H53_16085 [Sulfitobacter sp. G21635-S1]|uniref:hypothetical protein n=1 Tax=Sulfitobacter sp. G21635-S1 TaxID=3014043 RepID=UPI0022AF6AA4|nr:hypothetical protein [Sulfitobacter sp. G21635-S1]MCZ4257069.1 hypothetical protein [Sulfitobacter sp. G21635-S1]
MIVEPGTGCVAVACRRANPLGRHLFITIKYHTMPAFHIGMSGAARRKCAVDLRLMDEGCIQGDPETLECFNPKIYAALRHLVAKPAVVG